MLKTYLQPHSAHTVIIDICPFNFIISTTPVAYRVKTCRGSDFYADFFVPYTDDQSKDIKVLEDYMRNYIELYLTSIESVV